MPQYVLMLRDHGVFPPPGASAEEIQAIIARYGAWMNGVRASGQKLRDGEGRTVVRKDGGLAVTDGPYTEGKEIIGGYFIVDAATYDDVIRLVHDCPHLDFGSIEIREIDPKT